MKYMLLYNVVNCEHVVFQRLSFEVIQLKGGFQEWGHINSDL